MVGPSVPAELPTGRFDTVHEGVPTALLPASTDGALSVGETPGPNGDDGMLQGR